MRNDLPTRQTPRLPPLPPAPQVDAGQRAVRIYTFRDPNGLIAELLVPRLGCTVGQTTYSHGTEYWLRVSTAAPTASLLVAWTDYRWEGLGQPAAVDFRMQQRASWSYATTKHAPPNNSSTFLNNTLSIALTWSLSRTTSGWTGSLRWFNSNGQNNIFAGDCPQGGVTLTAETNVMATDIPWYSASVAPIV